MKFLYPIKNLNLKPWIKYWLLKKTSDSQVLSELIEGTTPIILENVYEGTTLQDLVFKGQTIQNRNVKKDNYININEENFRVDLGGTNIIPNNIETQTINGVEITKYEDGSLLLNGTSTSTIRLNLVENYNIEQDSYIWSIHKEGTINGTAFISLLTTGTTTELSGSAINLSTQNVKDFIINETTNVYARLYIGINRTFNNFKIYPMLEKGSQASPYSPFVANPIELNENDKIWNDEGIWKLNNSEITNTNLIEQLESLKNATLISGTNEITQTSADLPFILNFKYYMKG